MKTVKIALCVVSICVLVVFAGCEWSAGGGAETWDSSLSGLDFSGTYRHPSGGYMVTVAGDSVVVTNTSTNIASQSLGTCDGVNTFYQGRLSHQPLRGTVSIICGAYLFSDPASGSGTVTLNVNINDGSTGTINHNTGQWTLRFAAPPNAGTSIRATYQYLHQSTQETGATTSGRKGNSGPNGIFSMTLFQVGNQLRITDNNGSVYEGTISIATYADDPASRGTNGIGQFSVSGNSQGYSVTVVGALEFNGAARVMQGSFIESGGNSARVYGTASATASSLVYRVVSP